MGVNKGFQRCLCEAHAVMPALRRAGHRDGRLAFGDRVVGMPHDAVAGTIHVQRRFRPVVDDGNVVLSIRRARLRAVATRPL